MRDLKAMVVGGAFVHVALGVLVAVLFVGTGLYWFELADVEKNTAKQTILGEGFGASRAQEREAMKSYKRLEGARLQIPIERAMDLVVKEQGPAPAEKEGR